MDDQRFIGLIGALLLGFMGGVGLSYLYNDSPEENQIKAFAQLCEKFEVKVTGEEYRLSCDKGFIVVGSKGYLMASEILKNQTKK